MNSARRIVSATAHFTASPVCTQKSASLAMTLRPSNAFSVRTAIPQHSFVTPRRMFVTVSSQSEAATSPAQRIVKKLEGKIKDALKPESLEVVDTSGDASHVSIACVSKSFEGMNTVARHRLVYKAIWEELKGEVHAIDAMKTLTPKEAGL
eukprot:CAMPEP_0184675548 /NCGR_PEP_ID=MMETSP0308-20130426/87847_1 /TAXON_ID=38269 /ORGANISM="Gloeochaete witrockiana, Strain SAG 46.84" /LENGTH=150 /DNA_ID=CAMNT_0027123261 /DNA_START=138 /DNA_END=590 /DNA_ORIENTATION=+